MSSSLKNMIVLLLLIGFQNLIKAEVEPEAIKIEYSTSLKINGDKYYVINYSESDLNNKNYLTIRTNSNEYNTAGFIYASFTEKNPSADKRNYSSQSLDKNEVIINVSKLKGKSKVYINIHTFKETQIKFETFTSATIDLVTPGDKKRFKFAEVSSIIFTPTEFLKDGT